MAITGDKSEGTGGTATFTDLFVSLTSIGLAIVDESVVYSIEGISLLSAETPISPFVVTECFASVINPADIVKPTAAAPDRGTPILLLLVCSPCSGDVGGVTGRVVSAAFSVPPSSGSVAIAGLFSHRFLKTP
jgi:hypothetical protein